MAIEGITQKTLKNGDISWFGNFRDPTNNNMPTRKKLGTKKKDRILNEKQAFLKLENLKEELKKRNDALEDTIEYKNHLSLSALADIYFNDKITDKKEELWSKLSFKTEEEFENSSSVKEKISNLNKLKNKYTKHAHYKIGYYPINKITKTMAKDYKDKYLRMTGLAQKTKSDILNLIKTIINYAIKNDIINTINVFSHLSIKHDNNQRDRALSEEELKLLLDTCKQYTHSENVYLSVYLAIITAGRSNTILNIQKNDIDTKNNTITLYNFKANRKYKLGLNKLASDWLRDKVLPRYENKEYLIRPIREDKRIPPYQAFRCIPKRVYMIMDELFNQGLDKSNNQDRDNVVNFHTLRRSVATNLVKNGTSIYDVMILLNHSNITQTMKYLNLSSNNLDTSVDSFLSNVFN